MKINPNLNLEVERKRKREIQMYFLTTLLVIIGAIFAAIAIIVFIKNF